MSSISLPEPLVFTLSSGETVLIERQVNPRTSRLILKWSTEKNLFLLTHPSFIQEGDLWAFLNAHRGWIQKTLEKRPCSIVIGEGDVFSFFGQDWQIGYDPLRKKGVWKQGQQLILSPGIANINKAIENKLKQEAEDFFKKWSAYYAQELSTTFSKISIRDGRSRWGSCSSSRTLSYSWRLGFAPVEVAKYVCAHEVAHLKEMNHSPQFWALVHKLDPSYKQHRAWLKKEGGKLKRISFGVKESL